jgi:hypothetical protein
VAVSEIGRNFLVMSAGTNIYGIGMTSAFFHMEGTCRCLLNGSIED